MKHNKKSSIIVPFFSPEILNDDKQKMLKILDSKILTNGPTVEKFENSFKKSTNSKNAIAVSNATSALHLSLMGLGIGKNDEVIVPNLTFLATANSVLMTGATPVLADVSFSDYNIDVTSLEKSITKKTKAIIPVHFAGKACDMNKIVKVARKNNLKIIEDCAHAIGATFKKRHVGTFGHSGCFSFYPTKNITTLEGGMIITQSKNLAEIVKITRNHGIDRTLKQRYSIGKPWEYDIKYPGYNYRMDEIRASLGMNQLKRISKINSLRRKSFQYYIKKLSNIDGIILPNTEKLEENACHLFIIRFDKEKFGLDRNKVFENLLKMGISTSVHYKPLSLFSIFKKRAKYYASLKNSIKLYDEILSLPFYTGITSNEQDMVVKSIKSLKL
jgi:dTDP-4-amino-4,6-dideoxygalactose transaminase